MKKLKRLLSKSKKIKYKKNRIEFWFGKKLKASLNFNSCDGDLYCGMKKVPVMGIDNQKKKVDVKVTNRIYNLRMLNNIYWKR